MHDHNTSSTHPPLPPTTEDDRVLWLRLLRSRRVGVATFWRLLGDYGNAGAALAALPAVARDAGVQNYQVCPEGVALAELNAAQQRGARMICRGDPLYPPDLAQIADAPPILWVRGNAETLTMPMVALIGARNASSLGQRMTRALSEALGKTGLCIVSGMARGIDTAAHLAALDSGTAAVMGGGVDVIYPAENIRLAENILEKGGALISEQPMGMQPMARHFPIRNRIVSGLSRATVVVEAAAKSGSLITARTALDQGREVMAVPGHPFDARASGCNMLIRDGARLVRCAQDVIEGLPPTEPAIPAEDQQTSLPLDTGTTRPDRPLAPEQSARKPDGRSLRETARLHQEILNRLGPSPIAEDQLIRDLGVATGQIAPLLTDLELEGQVERFPGGMLARATR